MKRYFKHDGKDYRLRIEDYSILIFIIERCDPWFFGIKKWVRVWSCKSPFMNKYRLKELKNFNKKEFDAIFDEKIYVFTKYANHRK